MKTKNFLRLFSLALALTVSLGLAACGEKTTPTPAASTPPDQVYKFNLGTNYTTPDDSLEWRDSLAFTARFFVETVEERSGGRIQIEPFYNSVLGGEVDMFGQVQNGDLDFLYGRPYSTQNRKFGAMSIPYLFTSPEAVIRATYGADAPFTALASPWFDDVDIKLLSISLGSIRGIASKSPIIQPVDAKALKIRIVEDTVTNAFWRGLSTASPMPMSEVYSALQTGTIDGCEMATTTIYNRKFYEVCQYYTDIDWQWAAAGCFFMNPAAFDSLPADLQKIVLECAWEAANNQNQMELANMKTAYQKLAENDVEVYYLTDAERQLWIDYARTLDDVMKAEVGADVFDACMEIAKSVN